MIDNMQRQDTLPACRKPSEVVPFGEKRPPLSEAISDLTCRNLIHAAIEAMKFAYTPYSNFKVGAALMATNTKVYTGCNIENAAYGPTNCAERTAFFKAVSEGILTYKAIAVCGGIKGQAPETFAYPCGVCRQVMKEFCAADFKVIVAKSIEEYEIYTLEELLPNSFGGENLV